MKTLSRLLAIIFMLTLVLAAFTLPASAEGEKVIKVACVGDSITAGTNATNYPMYLQELLGDGYEVKNFGLGGAASRHKPESDGTYFWYDSAQYKGSLEYDADVVFVMMGTNDVHSSIIWLAKHFQEDYYEYLIKPYLEKGREVVIVTSPFAYEYTMADANVINTTIRQKQIEIANEYKLKLIDMNSATSGMRECFPDGLHGNASGYTVIAQTIYKEYFKGDVASVGIKTQPNALVSIGRVGIRANAETGVANLNVLPGTRDITVTLDGYKTAMGKINIPSGRSEAEITLESGGRNVALNCTATESSKSGDGREAKYAVDGDEMNTRWESNAGDPQWILLDFGDTYNIGSVRIFWEPAYASGYDIEVSLDGTNFTTVASVTDGDGGADEVVFDPVEANFLRVNCTRRATQFTYSMYELQVIEATQGDMTVDIGEITPEVLPEDTYIPLPTILIVCGICLAVVIIVVILIAVFVKKGKKEKPLA